jgi:large subunit ribosomal protein L5
MAKTAEKTNSPRFKQRYESKIKAAMKQKYGYKNDMEVPRLEKIVLNMGVGEASQNRGLIDGAVNDMAAISGQKPIITKSRKANAAFKLRENMPVGVKVTLRNARMYEFLDRLVTVALPRVRDFRGVNGRSFDGQGNYAMGITEHIIFPEINFDRVDKVRGLDIIICTTANTDDEAKELLRGFDMPFRN